VNPLDEHGRRRIHLKVKAAKRTKRKNEIEHMRINKKVRDNEKRNKQ